MKLTANDLRVGNYVYDEDAIALFNELEMLLNKM